MSLRFVWIAALVAAGACGNGAEPVRQAVLLGEADEVSEDIDSDSVSMPALPRASRGKLVAVSNGPFKLDGRLVATAGVCDDPPMFQLLANDDTVGVIVIVELADSAGGTGVYEVGLPDAETETYPAARVGIQLFQAQGAFAFQAVQGHVTLEALDGRARGRMRVIVREVMSETDLAVAAVFDAIPVTALSDEECRLVIAAVGEGT